MVARMPGCENDRMPKFTTIDEYIAAQSVEVQPILDQIRTVLHAAIPDAQERMRYDMPAIMLGDRYAIHFAAWKHHIGLYPVARADGYAADPGLEADIAPHREKTDSLNFPYSQPVPYELIGRIAAFLHARHAERGAS
jgi:uncharacterized protein YdhG (YjbR/CyaY superfamily)